MDLLANWSFPTNITVGPGCLTQLAERCKALNMTKVLLITDPSLADLPMVKEAVNYCIQSGLEAEVFSNIQGNPTGENVRDGATRLNAGAFDGVVAFGGGSSLDAAKAIAMIARQKLSLWSTEDVDDNWTHIDVKLMVPVVAVPTTAGTGSEVGRASVITDTDGPHHIKRIIFHPQMLPSAVLLDPNLTLGLPAHITAATGLDALSHNLEAYCASTFHPMAEGVALEGIRLIKLYLPRAVVNGKDIEARTQMLVASTMGATSFQRGLGAMHAIAHSLGALYNKHHGLLNAIIMPYVLMRNRSVIEDKIIRLSCYLELDNPSFEGFMSWILTLRAELNIPANLAEIGINLNDVVLVGKMSANDAASAGNPIALSDVEYSLLFKDAVNGALR